MPFTREQISDIKTIIKETITELFSDESFVQHIANKVKETLNIEKTQQKIQTIDKEIVELKKQYSQVQGELNKLQQHCKRKSLRIYGLKEDKHVNTKEKVVSLLTNTLKIDMEESGLENCFRVGKSKEGKRPILVTVCQQNTKLKILQNRKALKGTSTSIAEDMTSKNYNLLKKAREQFGKENVWFYGGCVKARLGNMKHIIANDDDLNYLLQSSSV